MTGGEGRRDEICSAFSLTHNYFLCSYFWQGLSFDYVTVRDKHRKDCFSLTVAAVHTYKFIYSVYIYVYVITFVTSAVPTLKKRFVGASVTLGLTTSPLSIVHFARLSLLELLAKTISISFW
jgi:hypothetical protein